MGYLAASGIKVVRTAPTNPMRFAMKAFALCALLALSPALPAGADIIIKWDFTGETGGQVSTSTTNHLAAITPGVVSRGPGLNISTSTNSINSSAWNTGASIDADDYYEFSFTVDAGYTMSLTAVSFGERRSATGIRSFDLRSSLDAFGTAAATVNVPDDLLERNQSIPLPGATYSNLTGTVTFRLYGYSSESAAGTWRLLNHDVDGGLAIHGSLAQVIPEPGTLALFGVASGLLLILRRRIA